MIPRPQPDIDVVGEAGDGEQAVATAAGPEPLPDGLETTTRIACAA